MALKSIGFTAELPFFTPNRKEGPENALGYIETSGEDMYSY